MGQNSAEISNGADGGTNGVIPLDSLKEEDSEVVLDSEVDDCKDMYRAEIDTSAPFESVKEAASRFGGIGFWKPNPHLIKPSASSMESLEHGSDTMDAIKMEEQASKLEKDLIAKEKETRDVLKELESTKMVVEELKARLQKDSCEIGIGAAYDQSNRASVAKSEEKKDENVCSTSPGLILMDLKQAKVNLTRSTNDLANIRATVESYKKKIEKERISLEKTRQRISLNSAKVLSLEKEVTETNDKLQALKSCDDHMDISREFQRLSSETEKFKLVSESAKLEVHRAVSEIEEAKIKIKTAEMRLVAAKKMKEAAKATEVVALADIKALSTKHGTPETEMLTITREEYLSLMSRVHEAEEAYNKKVMDANHQIDESTMSKDEILKKVEEATEEVKTSRKSLEEALNKVDDANRSKIEVEAALRKWRSDRGGQKRHSLNNSTKFKNPPYPSNLRGVNDMDIVVNNEDMKPILKPTLLSIGEILSRKLLVHAADEKSASKKVTLGQVVGKHNCHGGMDKNNNNNNNSNGKQVCVKRKKFGFARISMFVAKQSKKQKKKPYLQVKEIS